jgi:2-methylisocitrate lyase-like PEP mutase family enzyme
LASLKGRVVGATNAESGITVAPAAWATVESKRGIIVPAVWDLRSALAAQHVGAEALFLSGSAVSATFGFPDKGLLSLSEFVDVAHRVARATTVPLIVDADTGYGHLGLVARLADSLVEAGVSCVMIEDQEHTGQSIGINPGLCSSELMVRRIQVMRAVAGTSLGILARTDVIGKEWDFQQTIDRLGLYLDAGATWVMANWLRSPDELEAVAALSKGRAFSMNVHGVDGYMPSVKETRALDLRGILMTGQQHPIKLALEQIYRRSLNDDFDSSSSWEANHASAVDEGVPTVIAHTCKRREL